MEISGDIDGAVKMLRLMSDNGMFISCSSASQYSMVIRSISKTDGGAVFHIPKVKWEEDRGGERERGCYLLEPLLCCRANTN